MPTSGATSSCSAACSPSAVPSRRRGSTRSPVAHCTASSAVAGEAGVGKTWLVAAAARAAHQRGAMVLWAAGHEAEGRRPYGLWADVFDAWLAAQSSAEQAAAAVRHDALAALVPAFGPAPVRDVSPEEERARLFQSVSSLLKDLAAVSQVSDGAEDFSSARFFSVGSSLPH
ncbi:AAA family ATPase [Streptomyces sp. NBC_01618]|nr:AAA family ATPase [Streptomyces sp. NBC_01618]